MWRHTGIRNYEKMLIDMRGYIPYNELMKISKRIGGHVGN